MKIKPFLFAASVCSLAFLVACSSVEPKNWIVKIGSNYITPQDVNIGIRNLPLETRQQINQENQQQVIQTILNNAIQKEIIYQEALSEKIDENEDFQKLLTQLNQQYEFQKRQTYVDFLLMQKADQNIQVTNEEALNLYNNNINFFKEREERQIAHILVSNEAEANSIYKKLYNGEDFGNLAKSQSIHTVTAPNGGVIGYISKGSGLLPELENTAFKLQKNGFFAKPIKTDLGWHIVKLIDKRIVKARTYDEVKELLANELVKQKVNQARVNYYNSIKDKYELLNRTPEGSEQANASNK